MQHPGLTLVIIGLVIAVIGLIWLFAPSIPWLGKPSIPWLGKLPGDIRIEGEKTRIYIPVTTSILLSLLLTAVMWVVRYLSK